MFILAPGERHLVVKTDINTAQFRLGFQSDYLGKGIVISVFNRAAEPLVSNDITAENTGIY